VWFSSGWLGCGDQMAVGIVVECPPDLCSEGCSAPTCPAGTVCSTIVPSNSSETPVGYSPECDTDLPTGCRLGPPDSALTDVLVSGFSVAPAAAELTEQVELKLEWPSEAVAAQCAVFTCPPEVVYSKNGYLIYTYDKCAWLEMGIQPPAGSFSLAAAPERHSICQGAVDVPPVVTNLLAGCWIYGPTEILAATRLFSVDPATLPAPHLYVSAEACTTSEGMSCYGLSEVDFGVCRWGRCVERCVVDSDCSSSYHLPLCIPPDPVITADPAVAYLGSCLP
jgi:hypothetical protein